MNEKIYITGHRNPDTDSICSAIGYAELKRQMGIDAVPVRIGRLNRETSFVLEYFGVKPPMYLPTAKTQVSNLKMDYIKPVSKDVSLREAWQTLKTSGTEVLPVEDGSHKFIGLVSISDIANAYMEMTASNTLSASRTPLENVLRTLDARLICGHGRFPDTGKAVIAAMTPKEMDAYMEPGSIVFVGNRRDNQLAAIESGAFCVIITCGSSVDSDITEKAKKTGCILLVTEYDTFTAARLLYQSIPVGFIMTSENVVGFGPGDYIDTVKDKMLSTRFRNYPVTDGAGRFMGFISRYRLIGGKKKKFILVDHSERSQTIDDIDKAEIIEIIDHHRVGDIQTGKPIFYYSRPIGSTATIVANLFFERSANIPKKVAGLLCAAILSDTVRFRSPTSTPTDRETAEKLASICELDIDAFSKEMFRIGSSIDDMTPEEILKNDFKEYVIGSHKVGVGQVITTDLSSLSGIRDALLGYMDGLVKEGGFFIMLLIVSDMVDEKTEVLFSESSKGMVRKMFGPQNSENSFMMKGIVSRKNQIVPELTNFLNEYMNGPGTNAVPIQKAGTVNIFLLKEAF